MVNPWVVLYGLGILPVLILSSEEVLALAESDLELLREAGVTETMILTLRELARVPGRALRVDVEQQTIAIDTM